MFDPVTSVAREIANLSWLLFGISLLVFVGVTAVLLVAYLRFRARPGRERGQLIHGNTRLEVAWTVAPAVVLVGVFLLSLPMLTRAGEEPVLGSAGPDGVLRVEVIGHLWWWEFRLPEFGISSANELHLPLGRPVQFELKSDLVQHSFWVPQFGGKRDLYPDIVNYLTFVPDQTGVFAGMCAEFCGTQHAWMRFRVFVDSPEAFATWVAEQATPARPPDSPLAEEGRQIFLTTTCQSCHLIRGVGGNAGPGPELTHVGTRTILAAGVLEHTPGNMARWLAAPQEVKPGNLMPETRLSEEAILALTAYMESLK